MGEYRLQSRSRVVLHKLHMLRRMNDYLVAYEAGNAYLQVEEEGVEIIKALRVYSIGEVEKQFPRKDVRGFVKLLAEKGLVWRIDHRVISEQAHIASLFELSPAGAKMLVNPVTKTLYFGIMLFGLYLLFMNNWLVPSAHWLLPTQWYAAMIPAIFIVWWIVVFLHEGAKYAVLRAAGHNTSMSIIHKWHLLLPHTNMGSVRMLDRSQQIRVLLSGIGMNVFLIACGTILLSLGIAPLLMQFIVAIVFVNLLFELIHIPKTDMTEALNIYYDTNTTQAVWKSLKQLCVFCKSRNKARTEQEVRAGRELVPATLLGVAIALILLAVYIVPTLDTILSHSFGAFLALPSTDMTQLVDALLSILLLTIFLSFFIVSLVRTHELNAHSWFTWMCIFGYVVATFVVVLFISLALMTLVGVVMNVLAHMFLGIVFGVLFIRLIDHIRVQEGTFIREYFLPIFAASTGALLLVMGMWYSAVTGVVHAEAIYAVAYTTGMLGALIF